MSFDYETTKYIEGFIDNIIYRNEENGYTVFNIVHKGEEITCVGMLSYISAGEFIGAEGDFVKHPTYDMQFSIKSYEFIAPKDSASVIKYLGSGAIKGIGQKMAEKIVKNFGDDTLRIMEEEPERLAEIKGISINKAMDIANQLNEQSAGRKVLMFLQKYGIPVNLANKIYKQYGSDVYNIIQTNPYKLAEDIDGIGFKTADDIAIKVGIRLDSEFRIRSGIFYVLNQACMSGHVYLPEKMLEESVMELLHIQIANLEELITDLSVDKKLVVRYDETGKKIVYSSKYYYMEANVAMRLKNLAVTNEINVGEVEDAIEHIQVRDDIELDEIQKNAVVEAVKNGLLIVTGGPGTGKTTTINTIIKYFLMQGLEIRLAAPTGRASKRMSEACGYEAQTIHRLLEICGGPGMINSGRDEKDASLGMHFDRNEDNPLEADVIIVDEMSMVDINIMSALLKAIVPGTKLILVGDVDQLPSVGPGNVLKDIIASNCFQVIKLEKIFRQAAQSEIITNAHKINKGEKVILNKYSKDFLFIKRDTPEAIIGAMKTLVMKKLPEYVEADINEMQILTPSRKTEVGVENLNRLMQQFINPPAPGKDEKTFGGTIFRDGDKVMQIKNDYQLQWKKKNDRGITYEEGTGVFNGDTGVIENLNTFMETIQVRYDDGRIVEYNFDQVNELELAYAITIHKSQGSEYPAVVIPMYPGPRMLMNKNILYTAITRARKCVCLVGSEDVFMRMAENITEQNRYTTLDRRIIEAMTANL